VFFTKLSNDLGEDWQIAANSFGGMKFASPLRDRFLGREMSMNLNRLAFAAALLAGTALGGVAEASHFRGAAMVPSISASGLLTVTATTFWRPSAVADIDENGAIQIAGLGAMTQVGAQVNDTSDSRFTRVTSVHTRQLSVAGTYDISATSCCRVSGIRNGIGGTSVTWIMNSRIVWDGTGAHTPILFNFANVQPEVVRGQAYSDNLDATSPEGLALSYVLTINDPAPPSFSAVPGLTLDSTGQLQINAASTAGLLDNNGGNVGADYMFSGDISASDGSMVEFDWLFDAVNTGTNLAPVVNDVVINALVGDLITHTMTGVDPNGDALTWDLVGFTGPGAFSFNTATQFFSWLSSLAGPGSYIASIRASDGSLTDVGTITINLALPSLQTPEPEMLALFGLGLAGMGVFARRRRMT